MARHAARRRSSSSSAEDNEASRRLTTIPGVGPITASAIVATVTDPTQFHSAPQLAAWIGLVPKQNSSGGKQRQGGISKQGDRYLRRLLVLGATAVTRHARTKDTAEMAWPRGLLDRRPVRLASIAQANKTARIVWSFPEVAPTVPLPPAKLLQHDEVERLRRPQRPSAECEVVKT